MKISHLVLREISHRRMSFGLGLLAVVVAAASLVGTQTMLTADQVATRQILDVRQEEVREAVEAREEEVQQAGAELEDFVRKQMKGLGFNILILPEKQDLSELHLNGSLSATMPEEYVDRLAESKIVTINHLLPAVTQRVHWKEKDIEVVLHGTRGEVPIMHRGLKKPLLDAVAPGQMVIGHSIHSELNLQVGDQLTFMGQEFTVSKLHPERGSSDDVTVWIDLKLAQELLGLQNLVHAILALECECAGDRIGQIRSEIQGILPGTQVVERFSRALARAETRAKAKQAAESALENEKESGATLIAQETESRRELEQQHARSAEIVVPLIIVCCGGIVGLLAFVNARQRRQEVGILRALGLRTNQIMGVFLGKAALIGMVGGLIGSAVGLAIGVATMTDVPGLQSNSVVQSGEVLATVALTPLMTLLLAATASWIAALFAARQDAAMVLQGD